jgi:eukaryotic-like serine/threonine-protein kinase
MRASTYLSALAELHEVADADERRRLWRQGLAAMVVRAEQGPAPLEGIDPEALLASVRVALADGLLRELEWLSPSAAAIAQLELAAALPNGPERRELGRRVAARLRDGDRETFLALATALALSSPRALETAAVRSRLEVVLAAPLTAPGGIGPIALALVSRAEVAETWFVRPSTGSLPDRRLAARLAAHAAREAVRRGGDHAEAFAAPAVADAMTRLLGDREALVWRFAAVARGLVAHARRETAAEIEHELAIGGEPLRRAGTSAAAALERGGIALRWRPSLLGHAERDSAIARSVIHGLAGLAVTDPPTADAIAIHMVGCGGLDAAEALADILREEGDLALPEARAAAQTWIDAQMRAGVMIGSERGGTAPLYSSGPPPVDESRLALLQILRGELAGTSAGGLGALLAQVRGELDGGQLAPALRHARSALDDVSATVEWLERSSDDDPVDRRHALRVLRDLDREVLSEGTLRAALALAATAPAGASVAMGERPGPPAGAFAGESDPAPAALAAVLTRLEATLLDREREPELRSAVPDYRLRLARLRALIRLLDGDTLDPVGGERRLATVRTLMARASGDRSPLRRAVWAAMTRTWDALLRSGDVEVSDLLLVLTTSFDPDEDFAIVREATMRPAVERALDAYRELVRSTWGASDPDDANAMRAAVEALAKLAHALPRATSPRVEAVRAVLADLATALSPLVTAPALSAVIPADAPEVPVDPTLSSAPTAPMAVLDRSAPPAEATPRIVALVEPTAMDALGDTLTALALAVTGARRRTGLAPAPSAPIQGTFHAVGLALDRMRLAAEPVAAELPVEARRTKSLTGTPFGARPDGDCDLAIAAATEAVRAELPPAIAELVGRVLARVARLPVLGIAPATAPARADALPAWLPLSRRLGGFFVERAIGNGAGGSVFVATRIDDRGKPGASAVALKVPDYDGGAARSLSEQEFEAMFRDEAGALLSLPRHPNLAGFVTFDAGARPKPILVMELVPGPTLERALERGGLDVAAALAILDGIASGLETMHAARIAHLDIKPQNVILRDGDGGAAAASRPVLVDFGLAGRTLRPGCGSPHYGAPEVWADRGRGDGTPFAADVYAFACLAFEVLTARALVDGPTLQQIIHAHIAGRAVTLAERALARPEVATAGALLGAALSPLPERRPTIARLRAGFAAVAPDLVRLRWPLATA